MTKEIFQKRYKKFFGKEIIPIQLKKSIRINTARVDEVQFVKRMKDKGVQLTKIPFTKSGYTVEKSPFSLGATPEYLMGYYYLQEAAAQVPVAVLDPQPGEKILDLCASPGGKTTQISEYTKNEGALVAVDAKKPRIGSLRANCERMGSNAVIYNMDGCDVAQLEMEFDRVLVDAPCSGNCVTDRKWFQKRSMVGIRNCADMQKKLLASACEVLKSGGVLVYSTCSFEPEENEEVVQWALDNLPLTLTDTGLKDGSPGINGLSQCVRFFPHQLKTQGFFVSRLVKQ